LNWAHLIETHYRQVWRVEGQRHSFTKGPIDDLPSDFCVLAYPPHEGRAAWTYATRCMSQPGDDVALELHIFSPYASEDIVELLVVTAHYHRTGRRLGLGHTINFGRPWLPGSHCDHALISLPYLDGPTLEILDIGTKTINCDWLIPVTKSEVEFKMRHGLEALERRFEEGNLDYSNPSRKPVV
jgi:Suppressor of fused protein (SUFU)